MAPRNFAIIEKVRSRTYFGSGAHLRCECKARSTGRQCKKAAAYGMRTCTQHGAHKNGAPVTPIRAQRRYLCDLAASDYSRMVADLYQNGTTSARGRALHALLNKKHER